MSFPQNPHHNSNQNPHQSSNQPGDPHAQLGPQQPYQQPGPHQMGPQQAGPHQAGPYQPGQPGTRQVRSNPETAFRPERVTSGTRTGIRAVIAIVAALAVLLPLSVGGTMFAQALQIRHYETSESFTPSAAGLVVDVPTGVVDISTTVASEAKVDLEYNGTKRHPGLTIEEDADGRTVLSVSRVAGGTFGPADDLRVDVEVPEEVAAQMQLEARSQVSTVYIAGRFDQVRAFSDLGAIETENLTTRELTVETKTGAVDLSGRHEIVNATAELGVINGEGLTVTDQLTALTDAGSIDIALSTEGVPANGIDLATSFGSIDLHVPRLADVAGVEADGYMVNTAGNGTASVSIDTIRDDHGKKVVPISIRSTSGAISVDYLRGSTSGDLSDRGDADGQDPDDQDPDDQDIDNQNPGGQDPGSTGGGS